MNSDITSISAQTRFFTDGAHSRLQEEHYPKSSAIFKTKAIAIETANCIILSEI
jgi:hypothetical protein